MDDDQRLPTAVWVEAHLRRLNAEGISYYIVQKGAHAGGTVLLKLINRERACRLLTQQRALDGVLGWADALSDAFPDEKKVDEYIGRAVARDPDVWVIEIEGDSLSNPFEEI